MIDDAPESNHTFIPVERKFIQAINPVRPLFINSDNARIEEIVKGDVFNVVEKSLIELGRVDPSPQLKKATELAEINVIELARKIGLTTPFGQPMKVSYLPDNKYTDLTKNPDGLGFTHTLMDGVVVRLKEFPDYFTGSLALHELIHKYFELKVGVYAKDSEDKIFYETRRSGLDVTLIDPRNTSERKRVGTFVNELANYYYEKLYLDSLINTPPQELKEELEERTRLVNSFFTHTIGTHYFVDFQDEVGNKKRLLFEMNLAHFDKSGKILTESHASILAYMQMAQDLALLCGKIQGIPFMELLLKAKNDPSLLPLIQRRVDERVSTGFFAKLRSFDYNKGGSGFLPLMKEMQDKLYTVTVNESSGS